MAKNNKPQAENAQKVQTKYDRKIEERKKREIKEKRDEKIMRAAAILVCVGIIAAIAASVTISVLNKNAAVKSAYVTVGGHTITKLEYDYYYNTSVNNYINTYSSLLSYMGLDTTKDFEEQQYAEGLTWKDFFDRMAVEQIQQTKALIDDAQANGFTYDTTDDYANLLSSISTSADTSEIKISDFYKATYGDYATQSNMEPIMKEGILAAAYYEELLAKNAPTDEEIDAYYADHVQNYDRVDYRSFAFKAETADDASEADTASAMAEAKEKAETMKKEREEGADFKQLCLKNATDENKAEYEDTETDASLREGAYYSSTPGTVGDWLYEDGRTKGDIAVLADEAGSQYYVAEFIDRYYDEADDENISNTISSERNTEYIRKLMESYTVTDNKGDLKYLTADTSNETEEAPTDTNAGAEEAPADTSNETGEASADTNIETGETPADTSNETEEAPTDTNAGAEEENPAEESTGISE